MNNKFKEPVFGGSLEIGFSIGGLHELREYYSTMERIISETSQWQLASINKKATALPPVQREQFKEINMPFRWIKSFPSELRMSIIVSGISFLETQLRQIACQVQYRSKEEFIKPRERILSTYRNYFKRFGTLDIPNDQNWKLLNVFYSIRNQLVHNGMNLDSADQKFKDRIKQISVVALDGENWLTIEKTACDQMFELIEKLFIHLEKEVVQKWE